MASMLFRVRWWQTGEGREGSPHVEKSVQVLDAATAAEVACAEWHDELPQTKGLRGSTWMVTVSCPAGVLPREETFSVSVRTVRYGTVESVA